MAYVVGCQVDIGDLDAGMDFGLLNGGFGFDAISGSVSLPLAPGRVLYAGRQEADGEAGYLPLRLQLFDDGDLRLRWYAQARSYVTVGRPPVTTTKSHPVGQAVLPRLSIDTNTRFEEVMTKRFKETAVAAAVAGSVVAVSSVLLAPAASADVKVVLPAQKQVKKLGDGTVITVSRSGERATINPSMGGTPLHRNAWVSEQSIR